MGVILTKKGEDNPDPKECPYSQLFNLETNKITEVLQDWYSLKRYQDQMQQLVQMEQRNSEGELEGQTGRAKQKAVFNMPSFQALDIKTRS